MTAIEITDHGVEVDPLGEVQVHPAAELFPLLDGEAFDALVADIAEHGQNEPIVMTPDGRLLDGRNRWRACRKAGVTPVTVIEPGEPWAYAISANLHRRHLTDSQRAMIGARIATRRSGQPRNMSYDVLPPKAEAAAALLNVGRSQIDRARVIRREGIAGLQSLAEEGRIPVNTGARVAEHLDAAQQAEFVRRVQDGADPVRLAALLDVPVRQKNRAAAQTNMSPNRHRFIGLPALRNLIDSLCALGIVVRSTEGLDPALNDEEIGRLMADLSKELGAVHQVRKLLKQRMETMS